MKKPTCIDCLRDGITTVRKIDSRSGPRSPRCTTHMRAKKKATRDRAHGRHIEAEFGMSSEVYWMMYEAQGGRCWICRIATGKGKRLTIDHDHNCTEGHPPERGCPMCWRGLICSYDNVLIGRRGPDALRRAADYLENPPARKILAELRAKTRS